MMKRCVLAALALTVTATNLSASEPDGLTLPKGFHATVVAEGLGPIRHMAIRPNGDIYISTRHTGKQPSMGILALRLGPDHKQAQVEHFSTVDQGTGIRIYKGALYASSSTAVYRFPLDANALVPTAEPQVIVDGLLPSGHMLAFDGKGKMYVSFDASMNICTAPGTPKGEKPVGLKPCPTLEKKAGIWSFDDARTGQKFSDGEHFATGVRTLSGLDFRPGDGLYAATHGRDATHDTFPDLVSEEEDNVIADELFRVTKDTNMGWPYSYYDGARKLQLLAPEYGGDSKTAAPANTYTLPAAAFYEPRRPAVLDLVFYEAKQFPAQYRGGAFIAMHGAADVSGPSGQAGYDVVFVPFKGNKAGKPVIFADGFAGPTLADKNVKTAAYRPVGVAVGPDGALYVADSNKGRIWRIAYGEKQ